MANLSDKKRVNFRCTFNKYVTEFNKDAVVESVLSQFKGYETEPEVTVHDDGFILTLTLNSNLNSTAVRDKILWNSFIDKVSAQDAIRKIQIIRLPKSSGIMDFGERIEGQGSVGGFGPNVDPIVGNTGVNEKLNIPLTEAPRKYQIDADKGDSLGHHASVRYADITDSVSEGQTFVPGLTPEDLRSDANVVDSGPKDKLNSGTDHRSLPKILGSFKRISFQSDTGGSFTLNQPRGFQSVNDTPQTVGEHQKASPATGIGGGAPISGASWFVTQPGNEQQTALGDERNKAYNSSSSAPLSGITASINAKDEEEEQGIKGEYGSTLDVLGVGEHPLGGASYGHVIFGINDDFYGDYDNNYEF